MFMTVRFLLCGFLVGGLLMLARESPAGLPPGSASAETTSTSPDTLHVPSGPGTKPATYSKQGAIAGAVIAGVAAAGLVLVMGAVSEGYGGDVDERDVGAALLVAVPFGAAVGAALGALVGAAFPRGAGTPSAPREPGTPSAPREPGAPDSTLAMPGEPRDSISTAPPSEVTGSLVLQPLTISNDHPARIGFQAAFLARISRATHMGIEILVADSDPQIRTFDCVIRVYPFRGAGPYLVGDAGIYEYLRDDFENGVWVGGAGTDAMIGEGVGLGFETSGEGVRFGVEWRKHGPLTQGDRTGTFGFRQTGFALHILW